MDRSGGGEEGSEKKARWADLHDAEEREDSEKVWLEVVSDLKKKVDEVKKTAEEEMMRAAEVRRRPYRWLRR